MGRYLKNSSLSVGYTLRLPTATPQNLTEGMIRYYNGKVQYVYDNGSLLDWKDLAPTEKVPLHIQLEEGDGSQTEWILDRSAEAQDLLVFVGGVYQQPELDSNLGNYSIGPSSDPNATDPSLDRIIFAEAPPAPTVSNPNQIVIIYNLNINSSLSNYYIQP